VQKVVLYVTSNYDNNVYSIFQMRVVRVLGFTTQGMNSFLKGFFISNGTHLELLYFCLGVKGHHYMLGFDKFLQFLAAQCSYG
jgi:hypothetical protein